MRTVKMIRVTKTPRGEAPEEIRKCWVGLTLPVYEGKATGNARGVLSGKPVGSKSWIPVYSKDALGILQKTCPDAAAWWYNNTIFAVIPGLFYFNRRACETFEMELKIRWWVKIVAPLPSDDAPSCFREAWCGLMLPVVEVYGNVDRRPQALDCLFVENPLSTGQAHVKIPFHTAMDTMALYDREAADYWALRFIEEYTCKRAFCLPTEICEVIEV